MQRTQPLQDPDRARRVGLVGWLRGMIALALLSGAAAAFDEPPTDNGPLPPEGGNQMAGDETIGTLPILGPPSPIDLVRFLLDRQASTFIEGNRFDLFSSIVAVEGRTVATIEVLDTNTDTVRITFHGSPRLLLDRAMVEAGAVQFGVSVPSLFGQGQIQMQLGARRFAAQALATGTQNLPISALVAAGHLTRRRLTFAIDGSDGRRTDLLVRTTSQFVVLEQSH